MNLKSIKNIFRNTSTDMYDTVLIFSSLCVITMWVLKNIWLFLHVMGPTTIFTFFHITLIRDFLIFVIDILSLFLLDNI